MITASQGGDSNYLPADDVVRSFEIDKADQSITFDAIDAKTYGDADFNLAATASSGLAVAYGAVGNCSVTDDTVHITGAGSCTVTASQPGQRLLQPGSRRQPHVRDREGRSVDHLRGDRRQDVRRRRLHPRCDRVVESRRLVRRGG